MFCRDCGKPIPEGSTTCEFCSNAAEEQVKNSENIVEVKVEETAATEEVIAEEVTAEEVKAEETPVEENTNAEAPTSPVVELPKKKSLKLPIIAAVVAVIAVLGCVFAFSSKAQTLVMKMASPETHYRYSLKNSVGTFSDSFIDTYDKVVENCGTAAEKESIYPNFAGEGNFYVEAGGMLKDKLTEVGVKENKLSVDYKVNVYNNAVSADYGIYAGSEKLLTFEVRIDNEYNMTLSVPELNQKPLSINLVDNEYFDMSEMQDSISGSAGFAGITFTDPEEAEEMSKKIFASIAENAPDSKLLEKLLEKYIKIALEQITEVERVSEDLEIEGVTQKTTRFDLKINEKLVYDVCKAVLTEAKDDKDIKKFIEEYYNAVIKIAEDMEIDVDDSMTASDLYDEFKDAVTDILDEISDVDEDDLDTKAYIKLTTWVNSSSETVAIKAKISDLDIEIFAGVAADAKETGYEFYMKSEGEKPVAVTAKTTEEKGKLSGDIEIVVASKEAAVLKIKEFDVKSFEKDGYINGTFVIEAGKDLVEEVSAGLSDAEMDISKAKIEITVASSEKSASLDIALMLDGDELIKIGEKIEIKEATEVSLHSDCTEDLEAWASEMDPTALMEKLQNVLGENLPLDQLFTGSSEEPYEEMCEMCGGSPYAYVDIDGEEWLVCEDCYYGWDI